MFGRGGRGGGGGGGGDKTLREKAAKKLKGSDADPSSLKKEISEKAPTPTEGGAQGGKGKRDSKL